MSTRFYNPKTLNETLVLLERYGPDALIVNGGTDAVLFLTEKKVDPEAIIYIANLPDFHEILSDESSVYLGGGVTYSEMLANPIIQKYQGMVDAVMQLASPPVRAIATPAGNICRAAPSADGTTILLALRAKVHLVSTRGARVVELKDFFKSIYETVCEPNELVVNIEIPLLKEGEGTGYYRLSRRKAQDIAMVLIGSYVRMEGGYIKDISISLGALNAYVRLAGELERAIIGKTMEEALAYTESVFPVEAKLRDDFFKEYKKDAVCTAVTRSVERAIINAKGEYV